MKKVIYIIVVFLSIIFISSCEKKYKVTFQYEDGTEIISLKVEKGSSVGYPGIRVDEGYYYEWDKSPIDLCNINKKIVVTATKKECKKICSYYIDEKLVKKLELMYFDKTEFPNVENYVNASWNEEKSFDGEIWYYNYSLKYDSKEN